MRTSLLAAIAAVMLVGCLIVTDDDGGGGSDDDDDVVDGGGAGGRCDGLDLGDCRRTPGCLADLCDGCECDTIFQGCRRTDQPAADCPALGCPRAQCCASEDDCADTGLMCYPQDVDLGCGICMDGPGDCGSDAECDRAAGQICQPVRCSCEGAMTCVPGCVRDAECATGEICNNIVNRCEPAPCTVGCPDDFACDADGRCQRRSCATDLDCDGFCVVGECQGELGVCTAPPP